MTITGSVIRDALAAAGAVGGQLRSFDELAAGATSALRQAPPGLTEAGAAAFLATLGVESAWFRTTVEYGSGQRYAPFIGRTFVQLTWEANYRAFGQWCAARGLVEHPEVFVRDPARLGAYDYAWLGGVHYFDVTDLWGWANSGDFLRVSQAVNGGRGRAGTGFVPNGWGDRQALYAVFLRAGAALLPTSTSAREDDDMTPEDRDRAVRIEQKLDLLLAQLVVGEGNLADPRTWGWRTWGGGTEERLTPVDYWRRSNVETRCARVQLDGVVAEVRSAAAATAKQTGELVAEVRRLREAGGVGSHALTAPVVGELLDGGPLTFHITGTATAAPTLDERT